MSTSLWRISAPHFVAGFEADSVSGVGRVAPILKYMRGWHYDRVLAYCRAKGWHLEQAC